MRFAGLVFALTCLCFVSLAGCGERQAPTKLEQLQAQLSEQEDRYWALRDRQDAEVAAEEKKWFDEKLRAQKMKAAEEKYYPLFAPINERIESLKKQIDATNLEEDEKRYPKAAPQPVRPPSPAQRIKTLEEKAAHLKIEWDLLDDREAALLKGRKPDANGKFTFFGNEGAEVADIATKKQNIMAERRKVESEIDSMRQASP